MTVRRVRVAYGPVVAIDGIDLVGGQGRGAGADGPQRVGQVEPSQRTVRQPRAHAGQRRSGWTRPVVDAPGRSHSLGRSCATGPGLLLYGESVSDECRQADRCRVCRGGRREHALERVLPGLPPDRHPRDLSEGQRLALALGCPGPRSRTACCSTSRPVASTTRARTGWSTSCAASPPTGMPSFSPPTTWSSPREWPTGSSCSQTGRSSPMARLAKWCATRRSSPPRWPRCCRRTNG